MVMELIPRLKGDPPIMIHAEVDSASPAVSNLDLGDCGL